MDVEDSEMSLIYHTLRTEGDKRRLIQIDESAREHLHDRHMLLQEQDRDLRAYQEKDLKAYIKSLPTRYNSSACV